MSEADRAAGAEMSRLLEKVRSMREQREKWQAQLRTAIHDDDVTAKLAVTNPDDIDAVFQEELKKHDKLVSRYAYEITILIYVHHF